MPVRSLWVKPIFSFLLLGSLRLVTAETTGQVVDQGGKPIARAHLYSPASRDRPVKTDALGRFQLDANVSQLLVRHEEYETRLMRVAGQTPVRIVLTPVHRKELRQCTPQDTCVSLGRSLESFCFAVPTGVQVSGLASGVDTVSREFRISIPGGSAVLRHSGGVLWGGGFVGSISSMVWQSVEYREQAYDTRDVLDARGQTPAGRFWREFTKLGDSALYMDVDADAAAQLDQVIDSACLTERR